MKTTDATPPIDFAAQVIVMDRDLATRYPDKGLYIRLGQDNGDVNTVEPDGEMTLPGAVRSAYAKGYKPTHWMETTEGYASKIPSAILPA